MFYVGYFKQVNLQTFISSFRVYSLAFLGKVVLTNKDCHIKVKLQAFLTQLLKNNFHHSYCLKNLRNFKSVSRYINSSYIIFFSNSVLKYLVKLHTMIYGKKRSKERSFEAYK